MSELSIKKSDLDLGQGVFLRWIKMDDERTGAPIKVGAFIIHPNQPDSKSTFAHCWAHINLPNHPTETLKWEFNGDYGKPTFSPSILCGCGFHGFVKQGKWENA